MVRVLSEYDDLHLVDWRAVERREDQLPRGIDPAALIFGPDESRQFREVRAVELRLQELPPRLVDSHFHFVLPLPFASLLTLYHFSDLPCGIFVFVVVFCGIIMDMKTLANTPGAARLAILGVSVGLAALSRADETDWNGTFGYRMNF